MSQLTWQETFFHKLEAYRSTEMFKKLQTRGGYYSEADMRKPVSEGGLGFSAIFGYTIQACIPYRSMLKIVEATTSSEEESREMCGLLCGQGWGLGPESCPYSSIIRVNCYHTWICAEGPVAKLRTNAYDSEELEYWVDYRTEGLRGTEQRDEVRETKYGSTDAVVQAALDADVVDPMASGSSPAPGLKEEEGLKAGRLAMPVCPIPMFEPHAKHLHAGPRTALQDHGPSAEPKQQAQEVYAEAQGHSRFVLSLGTFSKLTRSSYKPHLTSFAT